MDPDKRKAYSDPKEIYRLLKIEKDKGGLIQRGRWKKRWENLNNHRRKYECENNGHVGFSRSGITCDHMRPEWAPIGFWKRGGWKWENYRHPNRQPIEDNAEVIQLPPIGTNHRSLGEWGVLPPEMYNRIFLYLNVQSMGRILQCGRTMYEYVTFHTNSWKIMFRREQRQTLEWIQRERYQLSLLKQLRGYGDFDVKQGPDKFHQHKGHWVQTVHVQDPWLTEIGLGGIVVSEDEPQCQMGQGWASFKVTQRIEQIVESYLEKKILVGQEAECRRIRTEVGIRARVFLDHQQLPTGVSKEYQRATKRMWKLRDSTEMEIQAVYRAEKWKYYYPKFSVFSHHRTDGRAFVRKPWEETFKEETNMIGGSWQKHVEILEKYMGNEVTSNICINN